MTIEEYLDANQARFIDDLCSLVAIPSVSTDPAHREDMARAADWLLARMRAAGITQTRIYPTAGHPAIYGEWLQAGADRPTILIYGHYDVQPPEPLEEWTSAPFEPEIRNGRLYGRGASDDKGGVMTAIIALEAHLAVHGKLSVNVKLFFEGEEEIGSPSMSALVEDMASELAADTIFSADGLQWAPDQPQIVEALKGIVEVEITVRGPRSDQHSGLHGGGIANPALALAQILAGLKSPDGLITVPGFYDNVPPLADDVRAAIARIPYDETAYLAESGAIATVGEPGYTTRERLWARPTLDVNGLTSGWQGAGGKTVLPADACAKISCRLVAGQTPDQIVQALSAHVAAICPPGVLAEVTEMPGAATPFTMPEGHNAAAIASQVLTEIYGKEPFRTRLGGSIPILSEFVKTLGVYGVMLGFSHDDENIHAPDEFFRLETYRRGQSVYARLLEVIGGPVS